MASAVFFQSSTSLGISPQRLKPSRFQYIGPSSVKMVASLSARIFGGQKLVTMWGKERVVCQAATDGNLSRFPRMRMWDPYKRLGITTDASVDEIWDSRNFLLQQYSGHEPSEESIEGAFEKILMASFIDRKKTKFNLKTRLKNKVEESPSWLKNLFSFIDFPERVVILRRLALFAFIGAWSLTSPAESGPAFQVAVSLAVSIYFLNDKIKSLGRAFALGLGTLAVGWVCGSIVVPLIPAALIQPTWTLELLTSLVTYVFLFITTTFLK